MALDNNRLCVFCGKLPNGKTREHVVPHWLLEMTGDPNRVVAMGQDFSAQKRTIKYSWSNHVAPACDGCNARFSLLEEKAKVVVQRLTQRDAISAGDYVTLLDWLDKVRTGVWLLQHMIQKHPMVITPNHHIEDRVGRKDRMVAVYVFESDNRGINLFGSDSLIFAKMPSCFGLRINDILLLNVSCDFFCSAGCGLPHPKTMKLLMGGKNSGMLALQDFIYENAVSHPILSLPLFKPVVWLYQPIKQPSDDPVFQGGYYGHVNAFDSRLWERTLSCDARQGALFRQWKDHVEVIREPEVPVEFDNVTDSECATQKEIAASVYDTQLKLFDSLEYELANDTRPTEFETEYAKLVRESTIELAAMYRQL